MSCAFALTNAEAGVWDGGGGANTAIDTGSNWVSNTVPSDYGEWAGGPYTVTSSGGTFTFSNDIYVYNSGVVDFDLTGGTVVASTAYVTGNTTGPFTAQMTLSGGTMQFTGLSINGYGTNFPPSGGGPGKVIVDGGTLTTSTDMALAAYGTTGASAELVVTNGGQVTASGNGIYLPNRDGSSATITVSGSGSTLTTAYLSPAGTASGDTVTKTINVQNGGHLTVNNSFLSDDTTASTSTITVTGSGSVLQSGSGTNIALAGSFSAAAGNTTLTVSNGGSVSAGLAIRAWDGATIVLASGGNVSFGTTMENFANSTIMGSGSFTRNAAGTGTYYMDGNMKAGDTLSGSGVGTLTFGDGSNNVNLELTGTSASHFDFSSASVYDKVTNYGSLVVDGTLNLNFNFAPANSDVFTLFTVSGSHSGTFDTINWGGVATGGSWQWNGNNFEVYNVIAPVPEPQTAILLAAGLSVILWRMRRKRMT